jgi:hypothetical protein
MRIETALKHIAFKGDIGTRHRCPCCIRLRYVKRSSGKAARAKAQALLRKLICEAE